MKRIVFLILLMCSFLALLNAASLQETLQSLSGDAAKSYVNPMVSSFGTDLNGGWFHKAPRARMLGWDFEIGVVGMACPFKDDEKTFNVTGQFNFTREQAENMTSDLYNTLPSAEYDALITQITNQPFTVGIHGPTITGKTYDAADPTNTAIFVEFPGQNVNFTYQGQTQTRFVNSSNVMIPFGGLGGILDQLPAFPMGAPQLTLGTIAGTQVELRYTPDINLQGFGKLKYIGYGIQHNPAIWIPFHIPVDMSLSCFTQKMELGDIVTSTATTYGANVSKTFGLKLLSVTPYLGLGLEQSKMKFTYDYIVDNTDLGEPVVGKIKFDVDGKNTSRLTAGLNFRVGLVNLMVDYNIAKYPSATFGTMLNFSW